MANAPAGVRIVGNGEGDCQVFASFFGVTSLWACNASLHVVGLHVNQSPIYNASMVPAVTGITNIDTSPAVGRNSGIAIMSYGADRASASPALLVSDGVASVSNVGTWGDIILRNVSGLGDLTHTWRYLGARGLQLSGSDVNIRESVFTDVLYPVQFSLLSLRDVTIGDGIGSLSYALVLATQSGASLYQVECDPATVTSACVLGADCKIQVLSTLADFISTLGVSYTFAAPAIPVTMAAWPAILGEGYSDSLGSWVVCQIGGFAP